MLPGLAFCEEPASCRICCALHPVPTTFSATSRLRNNCGNSNLSSPACHSYQSTSTLVLCFRRWKQDFGTPALSFLRDQRSLDKSGDKGLEEERRLAYVGLTRARRNAIISHAANRRIYANWAKQYPSRFLDELPDAEIERSRLGRLSPGGADRGRHGVFRRDVSFGGAQTRVIEAWEQPGRAARTDAVRIGARVFHPEIWLWSRQGGGRRQARYRIR